MSRTIIILTGIAVLLSLILHCSINVAGGTIETTNGYVVGTIFNTNGNPASQVKVTLVPVTYDPRKDSALAVSMFDTTTAQGIFTLHTSHNGVYNIEASHLVNGTRTCICSVTVQIHDTIIAPADTIKQPGTITIPVPQSWDPVNGYVYIQGTTLFATIQAGQVTLDSVPAGTVPVICYDEIPVSAKNIIRENVQVVPLGTVTIHNPEWRFSRNLYLNTTASGANVTGNVLHFPVCVRLTNDMFDFIQAKQDGSDIRFTKSDGTPLPYEIELWDSVSARAEIWVTVDTVYGNTSTRYISMYWGNSSTSSASRSEAVFDTAHGFEAVWHFTGPDSLNDATVNEHSLTNIHSTNNLNGMIGSARNFDTTDADGVDSMLAAGLLGTPSRFSVSAWTKPRLVDYASGTIISLGDIVSISISEDYINGFYNFAPGDSGWRNTDYTVSIVNSGWHYMAYTADPGNQEQVLYLDGIPVRTTTYSDPVVWSGRGLNTLLGTHGNGISYGDYDGLIDEVRFVKTIRSADWIKLCFMNQKEVDALIEFR